MGDHRICLGHSSVSTGGKVVRHLGRLCAAMGALHMSNAALLRLGYQTLFRREPSCTLATNTGLETMKLRIWGTAYQKCNEVDAIAGVSGQ